jgi:hypothetical protein
MTAESMVFCSAYDDFDVWRAALAAENINPRHEGDSDEMASVGKPLLSRVALRRGY